MNFTASTSGSSDTAEGAGVVDRRPGPAGVVSRFAVAALLVPLAVALGCSGIALPTRKTSDTPFHRFEGVKAAFDQVEAGVSTEQDLTALRFDLERNSRGARLPYIEILYRFAPHPRMEIAQQDPAIGACLAAQERCELWDFDLARTRRERIGPLLLDVLRFKRHTRREGWRFRATFLLLDGIVVYKIWNGTPAHLTHRLDKRPLGLAQHPFN